MGFPCDYYFKGRKLTYDQFRKELKGLPMSEIEEMFPSIKDEGIRTIAWTTGEQQNDRYDLSKQVDKVNYKKINNGKYEISVRDKNNAGRTGEWKFIGEYSEKELDGVVGKELATKIVNDSKTKNEKEYSGLDLKVGGKGMKGFYGSPTEGSLGIVGNVAKSLFKQEPKTVSISKDIDNSLLDGKYTIDKAKLGGYDINTSNGKRFGGFETIKDAEEYISNRITTQHSIEITPELRKQAEEGQPLFHLNDKGEVLGFTHNGVLHLNGEAITPNTTMEEAGHVWINHVKTNNEGLYQAGMAKIENSKYLADVKANKAYQEQAARSSDPETYFKEEALAKAIADQGAKFVTETQRRTFRDWVREMWKSVADHFGLRAMRPDDVAKLTLEEFSKRAAADVFNKRKNETPPDADTIIDAMTEDEAKAFLNGDEKVLENVKERINSQPKDESMQPTTNFEQKHGVSPKAIADKLSELAKQFGAKSSLTSFNYAYEQLTGNKFPDEGTPEYREAMTDFLNEINAEGIKLKVPFKYVEGLTLQTPQTAAPKVKPVKSVTDIPASLSGVVSNDIMRPAMTGVYFDNGSAIATDAHMLVVINNVDTSAHEGQIISPKTGKAIDDRFPPYKDVIPENYILKTEELPIDEVLATANGAVASFKNVDNKGALRLHFGGVDGAIYVNPDKLFKAIQALKANGAKSVRLSVETPQRAVRIDADNGNMGLVMPLMVGEDSALNRSQPIPFKMDVDPAYVTERLSTLEKEKDALTEAQAVEDDYLLANRPLGKAVGYEQNNLKAAISDLNEATREGNVSDHDRKWVAKKAQDLREAIDSRLSDIEAEVARYKTLLPESGVKERQEAPRKTETLKTWRDFINYRDEQDLSEGIKRMTESQVRDLLANKKAKLEHSMTSRNDKTRLRDEVWNLQKLIDAYDKANAANNQTVSDVDKKPDWMRTFDEYFESVKPSLPENGKYAEEQVRERYKTLIADALENKYTMGEKTNTTIMDAIADGRMSAEDAKEIIESAGLEVPESIEKRIFVDNNINNIAAVLDKSKYADKIKIKCP